MSVDGIDHGSAHARSGRRWSLDEITVIDRQRLRRAIAGTAVGNFMEWYDFGVYGFLAGTIAEVFFTGRESSLALLGTFATLAAAFIVRPLGGLFFGPLGDLIGRKRVLAVTILLMALGTTATGLLPEYRAAGIAAPLVLLVTRLIQGFSTGGEYVGAMTYIGEHSPDRTRGFLAGWLPFGTLSGYIAGAALVTGLTSGLSHAALLAWGWRVPFLAGAPLAVVGLYMRLRLEETPAFEKLPVRERGGGGGDRLQQLRATVVEQWRPLLVCAGLVLTFKVTNYMLTGYLPTYLSDVLGVAETPALVMVVVALGVLLVGAMLLCFNSTEPSTLPTLFPTQVRYGALAIAFNVSVAAFGGSTPLIAQSLVSATGDTLMPAYILIAAGVVGLVSIAFVREPARRRLPGSAPIVADEREAREIAKAA